MRKPRGKLLIGKRSRKAYPILEAVAGDLTADGVRIAGVRSQASDHFQVPDISGQMGKSGDQNLEAFTGNHITHEDNAQRSRLMCPLEYLGWLNLGM